MPIIEIDVQQLKEAFESLPVKEKIKLVEEFEKRTRRVRWDNLVNKIRARFRKHPVSQREINRICEEARQDLYERRNKGNN